MPIRRERVVLNIQPCDNPSSQTICGRQGDEGTVLEVAVASGIRYMDLDGLTATLLGNNPELLMLEGAVSGSTATFTLPSAFFSGVGSVELYVKIEQGNNVVASTQSFILKVEPAADFSESQAEGYTGRVDEALKVAEQASQMAQAAADSANAAASAAQAHAANYLRGEEKGALVHVEDAWPSDAREVVVYGKSEQASTTGKNLYSSELYPTTSGCYINNSTGERVTWESTWSCTLDYIPVEPGATYTLSGIGNITARVDSGIAVYDADKAYLAGTNGNTITTPENAAYMRFTAMSGKSNIQLEAGTVATAYEPYTGGKPSPSPEYPQEIVSIADARVSTCGKNLIPYPYTSTTKVMYGITFTDNGDGSIYVAGTNTSTNGATFDLAGNRNEAKYIILPKGSYTAYIKESVNNNKAIYFSIRRDSYYGVDLIAGTNVSGETARKFNLSEPTILFIRIGVEPGKTVEATVNVSLCASNDTTPYYPYTGSTTTNLLVAEDGTAYELRGLPDGARDELVVKDGRKVLDMGTGRTSTAATDGVAGSIGVDVLSSTGEIADGADVVYKLSERMTIDLGPADPIALPETVSNVWPVSEPGTELALTYERNVTVAYNNLERTIASITA